MQVTDSHDSCDSLAASPIPQWGIHGSMREVMCVFFLRYKNEPTPCHEPSHFAGFKELHTKGWLGRIRNASTKRWSFVPSAWLILKRVHWLFCSSFLLLLLATVLLPTSTTAPPFTSHCVWCVLVGQCHFDCHWCLIHRVFLLLFPALCF